jgi:hypothetical protein
MSEFIQDLNGVLYEETYRNAAAVPTGRGNGMMLGGVGTRAGANPAGADHVDAAAATPSMPLKKEVTVRPRTKYEQSIMDKIPERQKANLIKPQITQGKVYTGPGFLPNPSSIAFTDFVVGQVYKKTFELTNVSQGFNAFKAQPMPPNVRDVFDLVYTPQSMMSAGMSTTLTLTFTPKENTDIETVVPILAQTGFIEIPVKCTRKRCLVSVNSKKIDFTNVVVAERVSHTVVIKNAGALPSKFRICGDFLENGCFQMQQIDADGAEHNVFSMDPELNVVKPQSIMLHPFGKYQLTLTFNPVQVCSLETSLYFAFEHEEVDDIVVFIQASAIDVPVYVSDNSVIDLQCCFYDTLYRDKFSVKNTTRSAVKVSPEVPPCLKGMLEYVPKFGFVQPDGATFDFQIKFTPNEGLAAELDVPVKVIVSDQSMPIFYQLRATLSRRNIVLDPAELQFGMSTVGEGLSLPLSITNQCLLPRKIGFVRLPSNIKIFPESFFDIGPSETMQVMVSVTPLSLGQSTQTLQLRTEHDEVFSIPVTSHGKQSPLSFDFSKLSLPPTTVGCPTSVAVTMTNNSNTNQRYAFSVNRRYCVSFSPNNGELTKGESVPIVVTFLPTQDAVDLTVPEVPDVSATSVHDTNEASLAISSATGGPTPAAEDPKGKKAADGAKKKITKAEEEAERKEKERLEEEARLDREQRIREREIILKEFSALEQWEESRTSLGEQWSKHRTLLVPCFIEGWPSKAIFISVRCSVVNPTVVARLVTTNDDSSPMGPEKSREAEAIKTKARQPSTSGQVSTSNTPRPVIVEPAIVREGPSTFSSAATIDFASVPADRALLKTVLIRNSGDREVQLRPNRLDPFGPFSIVKPPLPALKPKQQCEAVIRFLPKTKAKYTQEWSIACVGGNKLFFTLKGEGLPAMLSVSLERNVISSSKDVLPVSLGACLTNDKVEQPVFLTNLSPFPLTVEASLTKVLNLNGNATCPFFISPPNFTIPANGKTEVMATFAPSVEGHFSAVAVLEYGGQGSFQNLQLTGSGWDRGIYVDFQKDSGFGSSEVLARRDVFNCLGDSSQAVGTVPSNPILLSFAAAEGKVTSQTFVVGNNKGSANGEMTIEGLTENDTKLGWKIDVLKSALQPGSRVTVTISFSPTLALLDSLPLPKIGVVSICNVKLLVKGGTPMNDATYFLRLKGSGTR